MLDPAFHEDELCDDHSGNSVAFPFLSELYGGRLEKARKRRRFKVTRANQRIDYAHQPMMSHMRNSEVDTKVSTTRVLTDQRMSYAMVL